MSHRPDPQAAGLASVLGVGLTPADLDLPWGATADQTHRWKAATATFWAAYGQAVEGHLLARDTDGEVRWIPAVYVGQSSKGACYGAADCSFSRRGVYRLDTGRPVWADVDANGHMRESLHVRIAEEEIVPEPLPSPDEMAAAYAATMRDRMWNTARALGAGVVIG